MIRHENSGNCSRCREILFRYPGIHNELLRWFVELQSRHNEAHVSEAGRGRDMQTILFMRGATRAEYGKSAHNWNAAVDVFCMLPHVGIYDPEWFDRVLRPSIPEWLIWYGSPGASFPELPHVEIRGWRTLAHRGILRLVE